MLEGYRRVCGPGRTAGRRPWLPACRASLMASASESSMTGSAPQWTPARSQKSTQDFAQVQPSGVLWRGDKLGEKHAFASHSRRPHGRHGRSDDDDCRVVGTRVRLHAFIAVVGRACPQGRCPACVLGPLAPLGLGLAPLGLGLAPPLLALSPMVSAVVAPLLVDLVWARLPLVMRLASRASPKTSGQGTEQALTASRRGRA
jgi:hypothetical protein